MIPILKIENFFVFTPPLNQTNISNALNISGPQQFTSAYIVL